MNKRVWSYLLIALIVLMAACGGGEVVDPTAIAPAEDVTTDESTDGAEATTAPTQAVDETAETAATAAPVEEAASSSEDESSSETSSDSTSTDETASTSSAPMVTATVDLNIRSGPGTNYGVVGSLSAGESAEILGKSSNGGWWKIVCPPGASGNQCWASAGGQFSTAVNASSVPVAQAPAPPSGTGSQPSATGTSVAQEPTGTAPAQEPDPTTTSEPIEEPTSEPEEEPDPTATAEPPQEPTNEPVQEAPFDNDSLQNPAQDIFLSITGTRNFAHANDISYSGGDQDDWVAFEFPNNSNTAQNVWITLDCSLSGNVGNAQMRATIYEDGVQTNKIVQCGSGEQRLTVDNTKKQTVRIHYSITNEGVYGTYTLTVVGFR